MGEGLSEEVLQLVGVHEREEGEVGGVQNAVLEEERVPLRSALFLGQEAEHPLQMAKQRVCPLGQLLRRLCLSNVVTQSKSLQMCPPIVTLFGPGKSVTEGKRHYSHAYLL